MQTRRCLTLHKTQLGLPIKMAKEMLNTVYADRVVAADGQFTDQCGTGPEFRNLITRIDASGMGDQRKRRLKRLVRFLAENAEASTTINKPIFFTVKATPVDGGAEYIRLHDVVEDQTYLFNFNVNQYDTAAVDADPTLLDPALNPNYWTLEE